MTPASDARLIEALWSALERSERERLQLRLTLETIMCVPSRRTLFLIAEARAMYEIARRSLTTVTTDDRVAVVPEVKP